MRIKLNIYDEACFQNRLEPLARYTNTPTLLKCFFLTFLLFAFSTQTVSAKAQHSVGLVAFTAVSTNNQVTLSWQTASELDSIGFRLYRAEENGAFALVNEQIIPANGSPTLGAEYSFVDGGTVVVETAVYRLTEVQISGVEVELATAPVEIIQINEPLPITVPTNPPISQSPISQSPNPQSTHLPSPISQSPISQSSPDPIRDNSITINAQPAETIYVEAVNQRTAVNIVTDNQPIILFQDPTPEGGYPPPAEPTTVTEGYVPPPTATAVEQLEGSGYVPPATATQPVVDAGAESLDNRVTIIGEEAITNDTNAQEATPLDSVQGRIYLWVSFIIGLLIFVIAIYATTLIFTRRTQ